MLKSNLKILSASKKVHNSDQSFKKKKKERKENGCSRDLRENDPRETLTDLGPFTPDFKS